MGSIQYPVVTAEDFSCFPPGEQPIAWLGMHFSPQDSSITAVPSSLPPNSILILDDRVPPPEQGCGKLLLQLESIIGRLSPEGVYLDFQRPGLSSSRRFSEAFRERFPALTAVSHYYADKSSPIVVLPPPPLYQDLQKFIEPWQGHTVWVEQAPTEWKLTVTEKGMKPLETAISAHSHGNYCPVLCSYYSIQTSTDRAVFTLWTTEESLRSQSQLLQALGVQKNLLPCRYYTK